MESLLEVQNLKTKFSTEDGVIYPVDGVSFSREFQLHGCLFRKKAKCIKLSMGKHLLIWAKIAIFNLALSNQ